MQKCVSCGYDALSKYSVIHGYNLMLCSHCLLLQTQSSERKRKKYVEEKYSEKYADDYIQAIPKLHNRFSKQFKLVLKHRFSGKLLDIGCGTGHFLKFLKDNYKDWRYFGVEPSSVMRKVARKNTGVEIRNGTLNSIPYSDEYFDVITCNDVLEHDTKLKSNLRELRRTLKPGGLLFLQAPNYKSCMAYITGKKWDWWCIPDHVLHFSYYFLTDYIRKSGFTILDSYTYEDQVDFLSNIKGVFSRNHFAKIVFYFFKPALIITERLAWLMNMGGLTVVLAKKN